MIRVQREDFDPGQELSGLCTGAADAGGLVLFVGTVRGGTGPGRLRAMEIEHYPPMTRRMLEQTEASARQRWPLLDCLVIHRYGRLLPGERIVMAAAVAAHRDTAFQACRFLIDWLKTQAPFWKIEETVAGDRNWVAAREADDRQAALWQEPDMASGGPDR